MKVPEQKQFLILVTAVGYGFDFWDGICIAKQEGLFEKQPGLEFWGHDISSSFLERSKEGFYPSSLGIGLFDDSYFERTTSPEFVCVRDDIKRLGRFLPASDIANLAQERPNSFDVVVCFNINAKPFPTNVASACHRIARKLVCSRDFSQRQAVFSQTSVDWVNYL